MKIKRKMAKRVGKIQREIETPCRKCRERREFIEVDSATNVLYVFRIIEDFGF